MGTGLLLPFGCDSNQLVGRLVHQTQLQWPEVDRQVALTLRDQSHRLANKRLAQVYQPPFHLISPLVRTRRTVISDAYSISLIRDG